ncbi:MAG: hypothetical protein Homavirus41_1, partial [Homavirus sp.]
KKDVYLILETTEKEKGDYTFIDIVVPKTDFVDFNSIETVLSKEDVDNGLAYDIYELILQHDELDKIKEITPDDKILRLINNHILIPIVDDFLLYHKDTEKYEKVTNVQIKKKKEDTKLRYIISKIDTTSEFYSETTKKNPELKKNIEKYFHLPLSDRKAILVNNTEELKIINKLHNQGRSSIENNEFYNDLLTYRQYPYINFKDFANYGIIANMTQTVDAVRSVIFEKQSTKENNKSIQLRVGSSGQQLNIVGFIIPTNMKSLYCLDYNNLYDVRQMGYNGKKFENGYTGILKFIKHSLLTNKKFKPSVYWLLDPAKDTIKLDSYEQIGKLTNQENLKVLISKLYDDIVVAIYNKILGKINNKKSITFYEFEYMLNSYNNKLVELSKDSVYYDNLNNIVTYEKYSKTKKEYDINEDTFPGLYGDVIKIPSYNETHNKSDYEIWINVAKKDEAISRKLLDDEGAEMYGAICQHNITWDNLTALRKKNPNKFNELLVEFIYQYIIQNNEDDFICKSCGTLINLKKYVLDGAFDDEGRYTTFSTPMQIPIEDIPEYEKYKPSIRNIDKIIERLASISNLHFLLEKTVRQKNPIKLRIIKDGIDTIILHNKNLQNIYKERSEKTIGKYGISKELTNLFVFELDNNIFIYSSKDKDHYKAIKRNNILAYLIFLISIELTDTQIIYMGGDKLCNFYTFSKIGYKLFDGINIIKNNQNKIVPIQKYKVLCYVLFYISCLVTKYNMWYTDQDEDKQKTKKFNPLIQKIVIHTVIDLINSILEISASKKKKQYLYNILSVKFFQKLGTVFKNDIVLQKLKQIHERKVVTEGTVKKFVTVKVKPIILSPQYEPGDYNGVNIWSTNKVAKYFIALKKKIFRKEYHISNLTNCDDGKFHDWVTKGKTMECTRCKQTLDTSKHNPSLTYNIVQNYRYEQIRKYAEKYCKNGELHDFIYNTEQSCNICKKCEQIDTAKFSNKELDELDKKIVAMKEGKERKGDKERKEGKERKGDKEGKEGKYEKSEDKTKNKDKQHKYYSKKLIDELKSSYGKSKTHKEDFYNHIKLFINNIENAIGSDVNINAENIFVRYDAYIIDHDHNGYRLDKPLIITDKDDKIQYKKNHPFFKKDVIYYTNNQLQIDVFYNAISLLLLGYKERNKDFLYSKNTDVYMKVNYSITNRLRLMGYRAKSIMVDTYIKKYNIDLTNEKNAYYVQYILKDIISDVSRQRILN